MADSKTYRDTIQVDSGAKTQRARILRLLIDADGAWVPLPEIMACAAQYNARVLELRRLGFTIENKTEHVDRARHSWFRLIASPTSRPPEPKPEPPKPSLSGRIAREQRACRSLIWRWAGERTLHPHQARNFGVFAARRHQRVRVRGVRHRSPTGRLRNGDLAGIRAPHPQFGAQGSRTPQDTARARAFNGTPPAQTLPPARPAREFRVSHQQIYGAKWCADGNAPKCRQVRVLALASVRALR